MAHIDPRQGREKKAETGRGQDDGKHGPRQRASRLTQRTERSTDRKDVLFHVVHADVYVNVYCIDEYVYSIYIYTHIHIYIYQYIYIYTYT